MDTIVGFAQNIGTCLAKANEHNKVYHMVECLFYKYIIWTIYVLFFRMWNWPSYRESLNIEGGKKKSGHISIYTGSIVTLRILWHANHCVLNLQIETKKRGKTWDIHFWTPHGILMLKKYLKSWSTGTT